MPSQKRYRDGSQETNCAQASVTFDSPYALGSSITSLRRAKASNSLTLGSPPIAVGNAKFIDDAIAVASTETLRARVAGASPTFGTFQTTILLAPASLRVETIVPMFSAKLAAVERMTRWMQPASLLHPSAAVNACKTSS